MAKSSKKSRKVEVEEIDTGSDVNNTSMSDDDILENEKDYTDSEDYEEGGDKREHDSDEEGDMLNSENEEDDSEIDNTDMDDDDDNDHEEEEEEGRVILKDGMKHEEMKELEKEYMDLRHQEQDILKNLRRNKDDDLLKGQAVRNQRVLWDKTLEFRFLLQMAFSSSNRLPQEPVRSLFCDSYDGVNEAYADLIDSAKKTLDSMLELEEALLEKNPSITQGTGAEPNSKSLQASSNLNGEVDEEWSQIHQMHSRMASFRDKSVDKWQRKTQVTTGAAAIKGKLQAFNQNISEQVASYMRGPSRMIRGMQQRTSAVAIFGSWQDAASVRNNNAEVTNEDGNPELLDDSDFYQLLLKELFESHAASSETAFYALKRLQPKKRKIVDRRSSKSRKIRYNVHEKIVNFTAPQSMNLPPMAPKLFEDLFGLKSHAPTSAA